MKININKCDMCGTESREDTERLDYRRNFGTVTLDFNDHYRIRAIATHFMCYECAYEIFQSIKETIDKIKKVE